MGSVGEDKRKSSSQFYPAGLGERPRNKVLIDNVYYPANVNYFSDLFKKYYQIRET